MTELPLDTTLMNVSPPPKVPTPINWNRIWDLALFMMAGGLIGGFIAIGAEDSAEALAQILFGAFLGRLGVGGTK
jgi:hypothetical protein